MCGKKEKITTDEESGNLNSLAVSGAVSIGIGFSPTEEFFSSMDVPFMSHKTFAAQNQIVAEKIKESLWEKMQEAAIEEKQKAIECGDIDENGTPVIAVIADGAWSKRSYRTNYNAASGVASIIGAKTKKKLFIGVRNKYCTVCERIGTQNSEKADNDHVCFKN
jgi:hypothetical protein